MSTTAKIFMSGRSQALRWPASLRLQAEEVTIEPMGDGYWIRPVDSPASSMAQWLRQYYAQHPALPDTFLANRIDPPPQERDWGPGLGSKSRKHSKR